MSWPPGRTALYRLYDTDGALLYIGIACDLEARWSGHASTKAWWENVASRTVEWHDERELAEVAETAAIAAERPHYNVAKSPWAPKPRELGPDEMSLSDAKANFGDVVQRVRLLGKPIVIVRPTRDRKPQAAIVPVDVLDLIEQAGGLDQARAALRAAPDALKAEE